MHYQFTPGAKRAIDAAGKWAGCADPDELDTPALLLGLLEEPECRAALVLAGCRIDQAAIRRQWPNLKPRTAPLENLRLSTRVELALQAACERLSDCLSPVELATEHLLLGLLTAERGTPEQEVSEQGGKLGVSQWLRQHGLDADSLETEILRLYGCQAGPLSLEDGDPMDDEDPTEQTPTEQTPTERVPTQQSDTPTPPDRTVARPAETAAHRDMPHGARIGRSAAGETSVLRILDVSANRAREGIRVVEDYVRFVLDDRHLTGLCKRLRHDLVAVLRCVPTAHRLAARETQADVGTTVTTRSEQTRDSLGDVLTANLVRLQESLRSLEEYGKLVDPEMAARLEQLRYRSYTLQRAVEITRQSLDRLQTARLYVLIDGRDSLEEFRHLVQSLVGSSGEARVDVLQLRDKRLDERRLDERRLIERGRVLRELTRQSGTLFIMNDRPDLAALAHADGVHLGQEELSVKDARSIVGPEALIGVSTHSIEQARRAVLDGANYIGVGPTFPSGTKSFEEFPGLELLESVAAEIRLPAFAIGGITQQNLPDVLATGIHRVAVSGAIVGADDPTTAAQRMRAALS